MDSSGPNLGNQLIAVTTDGLNA